MDDALSHFRRPGPGHCKTPRLHHRPVGSDLPGRALQCLTGSRAGTAPLFKSRFLYRTP